MKVFEVLKLENSLKKELKKEVDNGNIIGIDTDTIFGLAFNSKSEKAVEKLSKIKNRKNNIFTFHIGNLDSVFKAKVKFEARYKNIMKALLPGPITLIIPGILNKNKEFFGIRYPSNIVAKEFFSLFEFPSIVATSCNISGKSPLSQKKDIIEFLKDKVDYVVFDRNIKLRENIASTIVKIDDNNVICLRNGAVPFNKVKKTILQFL